MNRRMLRSTALLASLALASCGGGSDKGAAVSSSGAPATTVTATTVAATTSVAPTTTQLATTTTTAAPTTTTVPKPTLEQLLTRKVVSIAHGGGGLEAPDETLFTYRQALRNGADVLEMNLQLSADGQLVLSHDATVEKVTNGTGAVASMTAAQLNALDAAYWWVEGVGNPKDRPEADYVYRGVRTGQKPPPAGATADDFGLPTFQQLVDAFPNVVLDVEMEEEAGAAVVPALVKAIQDNKLQDRIVVSSMGDDLMKAFIAQMPGVAASPGLLTLFNFKQNGGPLPGYRIAQVPPQFGDIVLTDADIAGLIADGLAVWVWPNDAALENEASYRQLLARGATGIIADRPSEMAKVKG